VSWSLLLLGLAKGVFGIIVGTVGIFFASRLLARLRRRAGPDTDEALKRGNVAEAVLEAAALLSFGIVGQHAVTSTFSAMDLLYRGQDLELHMLGRFALYGLVHVGVSLIAAVGALTIGTWVFGRLTRGVDELAEVAKGNIAPALVLGAVMIVMAWMIAPGLQSVLDGLLPLPVLGRDEVMAPS
jgi:uncharacterized membrane protein YjfL (UPF0719 family)